MKEIINDKNLVAYCGLYCGACGSYLKGKCPGCKENAKATWCKTRTCCIENSYLSCADCNKTNIMECKKFNNFFSRFIGFILRSDRPACIRAIKRMGYEQFASEMAFKKLQSIRKE